MRLGRLRREEGQSLVEFALVLPVLALFLLGIIDFGRIMSADLVVSEAARDAARTASVGATDSQVGTVVTTDAGTLGSGVNWSVSPTGTRASGSSVTVTVSAPVGILDPLFATLLGSSFTVNSSVTMRVE